MSRLLGSLVAFATAVASSAEIDPDSALRSTLGTPDGTATPRHASAEYDLNADGIDDVLIFVTDSQYCGSGGCTLFVFKGSATGLAFISKSTITQPPIAVARHSTNGWRSLIVRSGGTGDVVLRFDGKEYPLNPSMQPRATDDEIASANTLISTYK